MANKYIEIETRNPYYLLGILVILIGVLFFHFSTSLISTDIDIDFSSCQEEIKPINQVGIMIILTLGLILIIVGFLLCTLYFAFTTRKKHYIKGK